MVCTKSKPYELNAKHSREGVNIFVITIPYITKDTLLPINIVVIKFDSLLEKKVITLDEIFPLPLSNSNCNLFEETNAISTPEKKADKIIVIQARSKYILIIN